MEVFREMGVELFLFGAGKRGESGGRRREERRRRRRRGLRFGEEGLEKLMQFLAGIGSLKWILKGEKVVVGLVSTKSKRDGIGIGRNRVKVRDGGGRGGAASDDGVEIPIVFHFSDKLCSENLYLCLCLLFDQFLCTQEKRKKRERQNKALTFGDKGVMSNE